MKVVVAPLNWGLGHATRMIPVIRELKDRGAEVIIASDGDALTLLKSEFPGHRCIELPGWNITYSSRGNFSWHLLFRAHRVLLAVFREHRAIQKIMAEEKPDAVISDNRLGCWSDQVYSVIMTHQVFIKASIFARLINRVNHYFIRKFDQLWIVDFPDKELTLSGSLSHKRSIRFPHTYIGALSRFRAPDRTPGIPAFDILAIVSGPEPQRSIFEKQLREQLPGLPHRSVLLRGKPGYSTKHHEENLTVIDHLPGNELNDYLNAAEIVVSRTGYTTLMDLVRLKKKAILIPTPGQPEQEYLADRLEDKGWFVIQRQDAIDLKVALAQIGHNEVPDFPQTDYLGPAIDNLFILAHEKTRKR